MNVASLQRRPRRLYLGLSLLVTVCAVSVAWLGIVSDLIAPAGARSVWIVCGCALLAQAVVLELAPVASRRRAAAIGAAVVLVGLGAGMVLWTAFAGRAMAANVPFVVPAAVMLVLLAIQVLFLATAGHDAYASAPEVQDYPDAVAVPRAPLVEPADLSLTSRAIGLLLLALAVACAVVGQGNFAAGHAELNGSDEALTAYRNAGLVGYVGMAIALLGLLHWQRHVRLPIWPGPRGAYALIVIAVLAAGVWLRIHRLDELPPGLWVDEALNGVQAVSIARDRWPRVALPIEDVRTGLGAGYVNIAAVAFWLFDPVDGPYAIRAVAAGLGSLGHVGLAALAWAMFGPRTAVVAAAYLAVSQYHLNYSRWGCMPIMSSAVEVLAILGLFVGFRFRGWRSWLGMVGTGCLLGAGVYTYQSFRLFAVVAGICGGVVLIRRPRLLAGRRPQMLVAGLVAVAIAAPMVRYALLRPADFSERAQGTLVLARPDWRQQLPEAITKSLLAFQFIGDENPRHNLPFQPLLTFVPALLAPMGLVRCLYHWRHLRYGLLLLWLAIALLPGAITLEAPHASRLLDAVIPLALLIGIAVDYLCGTLQAMLPRRGVGLTLGILALLVGGGVAAREEYRAYFVERGRLPTFYDAFLPHEAVPGRYLESHVPEATVFLDPPTFGSATTQFIARRYLADPSSDVRLLRIMHDFPPRKPLQRDAVYLLSHPYASLAPVIEMVFQGARCTDTRDPFGRIDQVACSVPREGVNAILQQATDGTLRWPHGLRGRYYHTVDGSGEPYYEAVLPFVLCDYAIDADPIGAFEFAVWDGFIRIPRAGKYHFRLNPDSTTLTIDGRSIIQHAGDATYGGGNEGSAELEEGVFPIRITFQRHARAPYFLWFLWQPPGHEAGWVPASVLYPPETPPEVRIGRSGQEAFAVHDPDRP